jgi:hypothetical protein
MGCMNACRTRSCTHRSCRAVDFKPATKSFSTPSSTSLSNQTSSHAPSSTPASSQAKTLAAQTAHNDHRRTLSSESDDDSGAESDGSDILEGSKRRRRHRHDDSDDEDRVKRRAREDTMGMKEGNGHAEYDGGEEVKAKKLENGSDLDSAAQRKTVPKTVAIRDPFDGVVDVKILRNEITRLRNLNKKVLLELHVCNYCNYFMSVPRDSSLIPTNDRSCRSAARGISKSVSRLSIPTFMYTNTVITGA